MQFTCLQENLTGALTKVYRAVPTKSELPILSNILITAEDNRLKISATNLSTTIVTHIGASIENEGAITVPAKILRDFVSNISTDTIDARLKDDILHLKSSSTKSKFNGVSAEDYPDLPEEKADLESIELNPTQLFDAVSAVSYSASLDDSRPIFTGIYFSFDGKEITLAASDGFRLSETKFSAEKKSEPFSVIIPAKTLTDITRVFTGGDENVQLTLDKNSNLAILRQGDTLVATRILDGEYPDYTKIIPEETSTSAEFTTAEFLEAVKLTDIFAKEADSALIMKIDPKGALELVANAQETGEHKSKIKADVVGEEKIEIGFNSKYLLDFLSNNKEERVVVKTNGNSSPCLFHPVGKENYIHIIMPMQINN